MKESLLTTITLSIWPVGSLIILFLTSGFVMGGDYTNNLDAEFWRMSGQIVLGHIMAFVIPVLPALIPQWKTKASFVLLGTVGGATILMQVTLRLFSDLLRHLDCGTNCAGDIMPYGPSAVLDVLTAVVLVAILGALFAVANTRRVSQAPRA